MAKIGDLAELLRSMAPELHRRPYGFSLTTRADWGPGTFAMIAEAKGTPVVATEAVLQAAQISHQPRWAQISLKVHSDSQAAGLTADVSAVLTERDISANVIAGYHHDNVFVQWARRHDAVAALEALSHG